MPEGAERQKVHKGMGFCMECLKEINPDHQVDTARFVLLRSLYTVLENLDADIETLKGAKERA